MTTPTADLHECPNCEQIVHPDNVALGCTDVSRYCLSCHLMYCSDSSCDDDADADWRGDR